MDLPWMSTHIQYFLYLCFGLGPRKFILQLFMGQPSTDPPSRGAECVEECCREYPSTTWAIFDGSGSVLKPSKSNLQL